MSSTLKGKLQGSIRSTCNFGKVQKHRRHGNGGLTNHEDGGQFKQSAKEHFVFLVNYSLCPDAFRVFGVLYVGS